VTVVPLYPIQKRSPIGTSSATGSICFSTATDSPVNIDSSNTFIIISHNITHRKLNEETLKQLNERLTLALLGNEDGVWDWNLLDNSIYFSPRCKEILGYKDDEILNSFSQWKERTHKKDVVKVLRDIQEYIDGKSEYVNNKHRLKHKDGHWVWIHARAKAIFDKNGKAVRMIGTYTDITQEKKQELQLSKQAQIIEQIHDSIISTDLNGYILTWNKGSQEMLEYTEDEILGKNMSILHRVEDVEQNKEYAKQLLDKESFSVESYLVSKSKKHIPVMVSLSLLKDENAQAIGLIGISQDITQRKKIEKELSLQKDILSYQAHHDLLTGLRNRLTLKEDIENLIAQHKEHGAPYAVLMLDIDWFKNVNDTYGHDIGDLVLKELSKILLSSVRESDKIYRVGGEEFVILFNRIDYEDAVSISEKIRLLVQQHIFKANAEEFSKTISGGLYHSSSTNMSDVRLILKAIDEALYESKTQGRNKITYYKNKPL